MHDWTAKDSPFFDSPPEFRKCFTLVMTGSCDAFTVWICFILKKEKKKNKRKINSSITRFPSEGDVWKINLVFSI